MQTSAAFPPKEGRNDLSTGFTGHEQFHYPSIPFSIFWGTGDGELVKGFPRRSTRQYRPIDWLKDSRGILETRIRVEWTLEIINMADYS